MRPLDIQQIGDELAVKWDDGTEGFVKLSVAPPLSLLPAARANETSWGIFTRAPTNPWLGLSKLVGSPPWGYALQPLWADGPRHRAVRLRLPEKVMGAS
jgi:hypothetical protein